MIRESLVGTILIWSVRAVVFSFMLALFSKSALTQNHIIPLISMHLVLSMKVY